jgi:hypothetical protein
MKIDIELHFFNVSMLARIDEGTTRKCFFDDLVLLILIVERIKLFFEQNSMK